MSRALTSAAVVGPSGPPDPTRPGWWTPEFLAFLLPLRPEQVLVPATPQGGVTPASRREWAWVQLAQRLAWTYGAAEALRRLNAWGAPE